MSDLAGFRNVLVHIYWGVDLAQVHGVLMAELKTLREFKELVVEEVEKKK